MGTDAADIDGNGWLDVFITHLDLEHARLYRNLSDGSFEDATFAAKLGYATFRYSGFGALFIDYDNDGARHFMANGHILTTSSYTTRRRVTLSRNFSIAIPVVVSLRT